MNDGRRPDASMSLLDDIVAGALDPEYAQAAARRPGAGRGRRRTVGVRTFVILLIPGLLLAVALVQAQRGAPEIARRHDRLVAAINDRSGESDRLQHQMDGLRSQVSGLRRRRLARTDDGRDVQSRIDRWSRAAGLRPAAGDGLRVVADDADGRSDPSSDDPPARIYDRDLQSLVNGLWSAGATAIAINGQRLTATTAIREAGESILVDFRPISPPYDVQALGDGTSIRAALADSAAGRRFRTLQTTFGIRFDMSTEDDLRLPGSSGETLRYAREVGR